MNVDFEKLAVLIGAIFVGIQGIRATSMKSVKADLAKVQRELTDTTAAHQRDIADLDRRLRRAESRTRVLEVWQYNARLFIGQLRGLLAQHGITAPEMPHELEDEPRFQDEPRDLTTTPGG